MEKTNGPDMVLICNNCEHLQQTGEPAENRCGLTNARLALIDARTVLTPAACPRTGTVVAGMLRRISDGDTGAYFAAVEAETRTSALPWKSRGAYVQHILDALVDYYDSGGVKDDDA